MWTYFEDELIKAGKSKAQEGKSEKKLTFVRHLQVFIYNHPEIHFVNVNKLGLGYESAVDEKGNEWREVRDIRTADDLRDVIRIGKPARITQIRYSRTNTYYRLCYNELRKKNGDKTPFQYHIDPCHSDEQLYLALTKTCKCGYSFNECDKNVIYKDVKQFDVNSFYSSLMRQLKAPSKYIRIPYEYQFKKDLNKLPFFGRAIVEVEREDPFLDKMFYEKLGKNRYAGWINYIDVEFLKKLCGVKSFEIDRNYLWICEETPIKESIIKAIDWAYDKKKNNPDEKRMYKSFLEKLFGNCIAQRYFDYEYDWNETKQEIERKDREKFNFEKHNDDCFKGYFDFGWGVWTLSLARYALISKKRELEAKGFKVLYGDIDCLKFQGDGEIPLKIGDELGEWKDEGVLKEFKAIDLKWYAGFLENGKLKLACSGANKKIIEDWILDKGLGVFTSTCVFPRGINPFCRFVQLNGKMVEEWYGELTSYETDITETEITTACAGAGKTTYLLKKLNELYDKTDDKILALTFNKSMAEELRKRFQKKSKRVEIRTIDSVAHEICRDCAGIEGNDFDKKVEVAIELIRRYGAQLFGEERHILIDEAQDLQLNRINLVLNLPTKTRTIVGDPNQSIYQFAGATTAIFDVDFKNLTFKKMNKSYRVPQNLLDLAEGFLLPEERQNSTSAREGEAEIKRTRFFDTDVDAVLCLTDAQVHRLQEEHPFMTVMTVHAAKGQEWNKVELVGCDSVADNEQMRHLLYVAYTRAKQKCIIYEGVA